MARDARCSALPRPRRAASLHRAPTSRPGPRHRVCSFRRGARPDPGERGPGGDSHGGDGTGASPGWAGRPTDRPAGGGVWGLRAAGTLVGRAGSMLRIARAPTPAPRACTFPPTPAGTGVQARGPSPGPARPADVAQAARTAQATRPGGTPCLLLGSPRVASAALQGPFHPDPLQPDFAGLLVSYTAGSHAQEFFVTAVDLRGSFESSAIRTPWGRHSWCCMSTVGVTECAGKFISGSAQRMDTDR